MAVIVDHALGGLLNHVTLKPPRERGLQVRHGKLESSRGLGMSKPINRGPLNRLRCPVRIRAALGRGIIKLSVALPPTCSYTVLYRLTNTSWKLTNTHPSSLECK